MFDKILHYWCRAKGCLLAFAKINNSDQAGYPCSLIWVFPFCKYLNNDSLEIFFRKVKTQTILYRCTGWFEKECTWHSNFLSIWAVLCKFNGSQMVTCVSYVTCLLSYTMGPFQKASIFNGIFSSLVAISFL